jgi:hypothetical protein
MTKSLLFDIEFTGSGKVVSVSQSGFDFLESSGHLITLKQIYNEAIDNGLHVRFANAETRDRVVGQYA